jgi:hypothetical protein
MATITGGSLKAISPEDIKVRKSVLNQLVDIIQEDVSGSVSRRAYQIFVTGGIGPGVTSSLFQTVYDQDFTLQTANPMFDMTVGLYVSGNTVLSSTIGQDSAGKLLFPSQSIMMREKISNYRQYAASLQGDSNSPFYAPYGSNDAADRIDNAMFMSFKRLFVRDGIKRETFAIRMYQSASSTNHGQLPGGGQAGDRQSNINITSVSGSAIFTDIGASANQLRVFGGNVGNIVNASNTSQTVGLLFYDAGTAVFDMAKIFSGSQKMSGTIDAMSTGGTFGVSSGRTVMGSNITGGNQNAKFIPDFLVSGSIDDIVDHIASARFQSGTLTAATFQNNTNINSTIIFCRASADEFNYSTNPTFTDANSRIRVVDAGQEDVQRTFAMPTTIGLHDQFGNLLAVAKLSRPIEKNDEKDITFRIRLDF